MAAWTLIPSLTDLRAEFNALSPKRDRGADGSIGDSSHTSSSDHTPDEDSRVLRDHDADSKNEVHALDIDSTGPWPGEGTQKQRFHRIVMRIIAGEKAKWKSKDDKCRLNYVIWDRTIYDKDNDFEPRNYSGRDPHTNHAHFSNRYETSCENDTRPWGVLTVQAPTPKPAKPAKEPDVAFKDEKVPVTATMGKELFEPDLAAGTEVTASTVIQLAAIHARRAALATDTLEGRADKVDADIAEIKSTLAEIKALLVEDGPESA